MIHVEIFTHTIYAEEGLISFEKNDMVICGIDEGDRVIEKDFEILWDSINDIDKKDLLKNEWYKLSLKKVYDHDENNKPKYYFELVESNIII